MLGWWCNDGNQFIDKESRCTNISVPNWIWGLYSWLGSCLIPELHSCRTEVLKLFQWWDWFFVCLFVFVDLTFYTLSTQSLITEWKQPYTKIETSMHGFVPIKLYLWLQVVCQTCSMGHTLLTPALSGVLFFWLTMDPRLLIFVPIYHSFHRWEIFIFNVEWICVECFEHVTWSRKYFAIKIS